jgi:hypothetical protein
MIPISLAGVIFGAKHWAFWEGRVFGGVWLQRIVIPKSPFKSAFVFGISNSTFIWVGNISPKRERGYG